jgi:1-acyl-sn-glycerol-3-phosphate acyltransferase
LNKKGSKILNFKYIKLSLALISAAAVAIAFDGYMIAVAFVATLVGALVALEILFWVTVIALALISAINPKKKIKSRFYGFVLNSAIIEICSLARIVIKVNGKERLPDVPYLLVCNHRSNFDNFILTSVIRDPYLVFISNPENFKIPFVGLLIKRCGYLAIDRENPRNALKTIHASADLVKNENMCVGVFPEGTRGHGEGVAPFSEGCFLVAKKSACPIVVASLKDTDSIHSRFPRKTTVTLDFVGVIDAEDAKMKRSGELSDTAYAMISASYCAASPEKTEN